MPAGSRSTHTTGMPLRRMLFRYSALLPPGPSTGVMNSAAILYESRSSISRRSRSTLASELHSRSR